ncbi:VOC family protein [Algiphilus sp. NNCM1]|uniref:VOC family protein n=1 Tax=Algiphilus sp. TaxID=1872431 RepID=UPI001CA68A55|nr:VOC family protein [Algiphilus sp.]MBY8964682.1 VOC family protein [Algiphilus acroporae]MCI5062315.1 VOC family protein [Algiphilus sp.]MCI5104545.1 VOC family protein [Algiphilus sp.]
MSGIGIDGVRQIAVTVSDLDRAVHFYADVLGMDLRFRNEKLAFFDCGTTRLLLALKGQDDADGIVLYFEVADIFTAVDTLRHSGIAIEKEPACLARMAGRAMWVSFFRDSEGALAALIAEHADDGGTDAPDAA